ncbi:hypothetical protein [Agromyces aerolatus]|uniref:hypothetical protein n=1 Tax=Agromyces sp. LY-1074 TaxID=3074080 RepID=UPI00285DD464|nr:MULTISPECIES: hypothetical protein [unclassified Agromyces]MDR5699958.1 hypothetical protein [Agromyces sp. LY-1074]MDR5706230.1 hypothetical protein [Agromyces sp. LY-1358]
MASFRTHRKVREKRQAAKARQLSLPKNRRDFEKLTVEPSWVGRTEIRVGRARWTVTPGDRVAYLRGEKSHGVVYVHRATGTLHCLLDVHGKARELRLPSALAAQVVATYFGKTA